MNSTANEATLISRKTIGKNLLLLLLSGVFIQLFNAISILLIARELGTAEYGLYTASFAFVRVLSVLYNLGIDTYLLRKGQLLSSQLGSLIKSAVITKILVAILWIIVMSLIYLVLDPAKYPPMIYFAAVLSIIFDGIFTTIITLLKSNLDNFITFIFSVTFSVSFFVGTILLVDQNINKAGPYAILRFVIAFLISFILWFVVSNRYKLASDINIVKDIFSKTWYYAISDALAIIYQSIDIVIITYMLGTEMVGIYSPAVLVISAMYVVPQAIMNLAVPLMSRQINDRNMTKKRIGLILGGFSAIGVVLWIITYLFGKSLIILTLGDQYAATGDVLTILSPIIFLKSISFALVSLIIGADLQKYRVTCQTIAAVVNIALNLLVVNRFGVTGVAYVFVISEAVLAIGYYIVVHKWFIQFQRKYVIT